MFEIRYQGRSGSKFLPMHPERKYKNLFNAVQEAMCLKERNSYIRYKVFEYRDPVAVLEVF